MSQEKTENQITTIQAEAWKIFVTKNGDYGASFAYLRPKSMTDQLLIKIFRIRTIEESGTQKVDDPIRDDMIGILNYAVMEIIRLHHSEQDLAVMPKDALVKEYDDIFQSVTDLRQNKNHDYGEIWRMMRTQSITDQIYSKVVRIRTIEENAGSHSNISEGIESLLRDIVNYAFFWIIQYDEKKAAHN